MRSLISLTSYAPFLNSTARLRWQIARTTTFQPRHLTTSTSDKKPDLIVVGSGIAGLSAAITAAEKGASVLVIERFHGGGTSALSGGVVYAGGGTRQQKEAGFEDTPENMLAYLRQEVGSAVDEATLRRFCDQSVENLEWLEKHGARFEASMCPYKTSYPTNKHYLYYSGSEKAYPFNEKATPIPRGHRMVHPGFSGSGLAQALLDSAKRLGIRLLPATKVEEVLLNGNGSVRGVKCRTIRHDSKLQKHKKLTQRALQYQLPLPPLAAMFHKRANAIFERESRIESIEAPSVVLAAGGFTFNPEMRQMYLPEFSGVAPLGTPADDGAGIKLGIAAGGLMSHMNRMSAWRFLYPPTALLEGVVVSQEGQRIGAEDVYGALLTEKMILNHQSRGFLILDSTQWAKARKQIWEQTASFVRLQRLHWLYWGYKRANSVQDLARKFGISEKGLARTVEEYNRAIERAERDPMNKMPDIRSPLLTPPFYGIDISATPNMGVQMVLGLTLGGLRVDGETGLVLNDKGGKIGGLYAAGRTAVGVCSDGYISGLSLADGVFSGRRAAHHAIGRS
ncbi:FAD-binding-2 domain-containing protein [Fusarium keratoplasticum]|nr:FAD-binding-2 domain-containing protein [Fusarium keratoplasticum]